MHLKSIFSFLILFCFSLTVTYGQTSPPNCGTVILDNGFMENPVGSGTYTFSLSYSNPSLPQEPAEGLEMKIQVQMFGDLGTYMLSFPSSCGYSAEDLGSNLFEITGPANPPCFPASLGTITLNTDQISTCLGAEIISVQLFDEETLNTDCEISISDALGNFISTCPNVAPEECGAVEIDFQEDASTPGFNLRYDPAEETPNLDPLFVTLEIDFYGDIDIADVNCTIGNCSAPINNTITLIQEYPFPNNNVFGTVSISTEENECWGAIVRSAVFTYPGNVTCEVSVAGVNVSNCEITLPETCGIISFPNGFELTDQSSLTYAVGFNLFQIPDYLFSLTSIDLFLTGTTGTIQSDISIISDDFSTTTLDHMSFRLQATGPFPQNTFSSTVEFANTVPNECLDLGFTNARLHFADGYTCDITLPSSISQNCSFSGDIGLASCPNEFPLALEDMTVVAIGEDDDVLVDSPNSQGEYAIIPEILQDYEVVVDINSLPHDPDLVSGISTNDILRITQHILDIIPFTTNWQLLAGDVDLNKDINVLDDVAVRRNVLGLTIGFPEHPTSSGAWICPAIIDDYDGATVPEFTTSYTRTYSGQGVSGLDFTAVELGNLNLIPCDDDDAQFELLDGRVVIEDMEIGKGETVTVPVSITNFNKLSVLDFTFQYDTKAITLKAVTSGDLQMVQDDTYHINEGTGTVRGIWFPETMTIAQAPSQSPNEFYLEITASQEIKKLSDVIKLLEGGEHNRIYPLLVKEKKMLEASEAAPIGKNQVTQSINWLKDNKPMVHSPTKLVSANPFTDELIFSFDSQVIQSATVQLFSLTGKVTVAQTVQLEIGTNQFRLGHLEHLSAGVYTYRVLYNGGHSSAGKVIKR